ncbi:MAG: DUF2911 domain-containing protein [Ignavibacteriaceae bacterium]|jgi:hypothetical protein
MLQYNMKMWLYGICCILLISSSAILAQQDNKSMQNKKTVQSNDKTIAPWNKDVRVSPKSSVSQTIGITDVIVSYSSPGVKGRKIWGGLVPFDKVWRAGANEATKITFSGKVWIEGKELPAGSYGFFVIPKEKEWTIIFNKVADQWGAFEYNESQDALRFNIAPQQGDYHEWLNYTFGNLNVNSHGKNSALLILSWEKIKLPIKIETEVK